MARLHVGLTGGIASGKSAATRAFESLGVDVIDADHVARAVVAPGTAGLAAVVAHFGAGVLDTTGHLDRAAMRRRVFADADARAALEAIVHPRVRDGLHAQARALDADMVILAVPLLAEGGGRAAYPWLDRIVVIDAPVTLQRERLVRRDGIDRSLADAMIAAQAPRAQRLAIADEILVNDADEAALEASVAWLHRRWTVLLAPASA